MGTISVPSRTLCPTVEVANGDFCFLTERDWGQKSCYGNSIKGVMLFLLWCTLFYIWFLPFFKTKLPGLSELKIDFSRALKFTLTPSIPRSQWLFSLQPSYTADFQNFPGPLAFFQDFLILQNAIIKFQDFLGPIRTL